LRPGLLDVAGSIRTGVRLRRDDDRAHVELVAADRVLGARAPDLGEKGSDIVP
jgi:hypothetical protein